MGTTFSSSRAAAKGFAATPSMVRPISSGVLRIIRQQRGKSRKASPPSIENAHETPSVSTSTRATNGRNAPDREVPMLTSPKARPR